MLVLTRKIGEVVEIGDGIKVYVVDVMVRSIRDGKVKHMVKLGFEAPADVPIYRQEVAEKIRKET